MQALPARDWIDRCAARLHAHWPTLEAVQLADVAIDLWNATRWRDLAPERAAVEWLKQGVLTDA